MALPTLGATANWNGGGGPPLFDPNPTVWKVWNVLAAASGPVTTWIGPEKLPKGTVTTILVPSGLTESTAAMAPPRRTMVLRGSKPDPRIVTFSPGLAWVGVNEAILGTTVKLPGLNASPPRFRIATGPVTAPTGTR